MNRPLRIGFDAHVLDGRYQGSRTVITNLASALELSGANVSMFRSSVSGDLKIDGKGFLSRSISFAKSKFARDQDALIFQYISPPWMQRSVVFIHDILPITHPKYFGRLFRIRSHILFSASMFWSRRVICVSKYTANEVRSRYSWLSPKVVVVRNGPSFADDVYFDESSLAPGSRPYILTVGRIEARKNINLLVKSFKRLGLEGVDLRIVGRPEPGVRVEVADNVHFMQDVDDKALANLYRSASLFVYPSSAEGFGIPLLDAGLFGLPVISSNKTAMTEVAMDTAIYFDPDKLDAEVNLANLIARHFGDEPIPRPTLAERKAHLKAFSWASAAEALLQAVGEMR